MSSFALTIPDWFLTVFLTLMTVSIVTSIIDLVLKVQIKKNQDELDAKIKIQTDAWKASELHNDKRG